MTQVYKAQDEFEIDGVTVRRGEEIALSAREGEKLVKEGKLSVSTRELDMNEPKDVALGAAADKRKEAKHENLKEEEEGREEAVAEREAVNDEARAEKITKATDLAAVKLGEEPAHFEGMTEEELDKEIEKLQAVPMPMAKYKITGEAPYTDEEGNHQGYLEVGSIQELPVVIGKQFIEAGVAEAYEPVKEEEETPKTTPRGKGK